jgi:hypothetical protein
MKIGRFECLLFAGSRHSEISEKAASLAPHEVIELLHQSCDIPEGIEISLPDLDDIPDFEPNDPRVKILLEREE